MSDSGISTASNDADTGKVDELEVVFDEEEEERDDASDKIRSSSFVQAKHYLSRSVMNLGAATSYPSSMSTTSSLSRSESSCSLASSIGSLNPVTVSDIRSLTNNYQRMLRKATKEIKKLNQDVRKMEKEQEKLLETNVELALETKNLLLQQKAWKKDEQDLVKANEEFAAEVERLYRVEEELAKEEERLQNQMKKMEEKNVEEKEKLVTEISDLKISLNNANEESSQLLAKKKSVEDELSCSIEYIRSSYKSDRINFESKIDSLEIALAKEKQRREDCDVKAWKLSQDLEKSTSDHEKMAAKYHDNLINIEEKVTRLREENEKLKSENFNFVIENGDLKKSREDQLDIDQNLRKEMSQLNLENQWLINNVKQGRSKVVMVGNDDEEDVEKVKKELREEKEKVMNLTCWKSQLVEKNNKILAENLRLLQRNEYLEGLVDNEVTDINEILTVINSSM